MQQLNHVNFDANIIQHHINLRSSWVPKEKQLEIQFLSQWQSKFKYHIMIV
jgi:hypothetical protein